jgi:hypothetical protein
MVVDHAKRSRLAFSDHSGTLQDNRYSHEDGTMGLMAYRHGLQAAEPVDPRWRFVPPLAYNSQKMLCLHYQPERV